MFVLLFAAIKVAGQTTGYLRFDTVRIMKQNGSCELYLINKTKDSLGVLTNVGGGLTQFRKPKMLNDSTIIIGLDTLTIKGAVGSSTWEQVLNNGDTLLSHHRVIAQNKSFTIDSVASFTARTKTYVPGDPVNRGLFSRLEISPTSIDLFAEDGTVRSYGFQASTALTQMWAIGHEYSHSGFVQADTNRVALESEPNRFYVMHDSVTLTNINGGDIDFRIRTLPSTIDTSYKSLVSGPNGQVFLRPGDNGGGGSGSGPLDNVLALGGRFTADRSVSMAHRRWDLDSSAMRLRGVDSAAISIDMAKAGDVLRINKPEGTARTYAGSTAFKIIIENSTDDEPTERNNPVKWGWNINRADSTNAAGVWYSMEPNYRPGGARWIENMLEVSLPNGTLKNSRLFMSTFKRGAGDSIESSQNQWDFRGTGWSFMNLTSTVDYVGMGPGTLNVNNSTAGSTDFSISNGADIGHFSLAPGTSILDYTGPKFRVNGAINLSLKNGTSTERELMSFEGDGGTTGYIGKYNSAWASQPHLQNGMVILAANGTPTETMLLLKPGGTAWLGDLDSYNSGTQKVNISGTLALRGIGKVTTAPEILVRTSDSTTRGMDTASFRTMMGIGSAGVTSVNSMTGPAITITAGTGITTSSASNDVTIAVDVNNSVLPHSIDKQFIDANNTGTSETDLYTKSIAGGTLGSNGQSLAFEVAGTFNDATATANLQLYFAGTAFAGTGAMTISGTGAWRAHGSVIRVSSSVYRSNVTFIVDNTTQKTFTSTANVTSVDFTTSNTFKITGTAGGGGGGSNDITAQMWTVLYNP